MKSFNRAISKWLLVATTILYSTQYVEARTKEITLNDFNKEFLDKCGVVDDTTTDVMTNDDFGKIFYPLGATGNDRQYITYNKNPVYDFKIMIDNKITTKNGYNIIKFSERGGYNNLVVKTCNDEEYNTTNTYTLNNNTNINMPANTRFIVPQGITLTKSGDKRFFVFNQKCTAICLGTIVTNSQLSLFEGQNISTIIFGPNTKLLRKYNTTSTIYTGNNNTNYLFYSGSQVIYQ